MASGLHFIVVLCLTSGLTIAANEADDFCDPGWSPYNQKCYTFFHDEKDWADAERFCTTLGANLASIQSDDEYIFLRNLVRQVTGSYTATWLGGYDAAKEGVWMWSDGSMFDFTGWAAGEPNNSNGEHCMEMNYAGNDHVNDASCNAKRSFFCVKSL